MIRPVLTVDDDPQVLGTITRDLRRHYRSEYRIDRAGSGDEALRAPGGQAGTSSRIENYLGSPSGLSGADLACVGTEPPTEWLEGVVAVHFIHRVPARL